MAAGRPGARLLVEHHEVLGARAERRHAVVAALPAQTQRVLVEADRPVDVAHREVDGAQAQTGGERGGTLVAHAPSMPHAGQRREAKKSTSSAAHSARSSPPSTAGRWLKRRSPSTSSTLPAAPAFGSAVP